MKSDYKWSFTILSKQLDTISQCPKTFKYQKLIMHILAWDSVEKVSIKNTKTIGGRQLFVRHSLNLMSNEWLTKYHKCILHLFFHCFFNSISSQEIITTCFSVFNSNFQSGIKLVLKLIDLDIKRNPTY